MSVMVSPVASPWTVVVVKVRTPVTGSYAVPVVAVKLPPPVLLIPSALAFTNLCSPVNVLDFPVNSELTSLIKSTLLN